MKLLLMRGSPKGPQIKVRQGNPVGMTIHCFTVTLGLLFLASDKDHPDPTVIWTHNGERGVFMVSWFTSIKNMTLWRTRVWDHLMGKTSLLQSCTSGKARHWGAGICQSLWKLWVHHQNCPPQSHDNVANNSKVLPSKSFSIFPLLDSTETSESGQ